MSIRGSKKWLVLPGAGVLLAALALASCGGGGEKITEAGSTTVQPAAEKLARAFEKDHDVSVSIQGGGSSVGVKAVAEGTVDIGACSRELKPEEKQMHLVEHQIAWDGIAIITHPSNPLTGLTMKQVKSIYAGEITNWKDVGGEDKSIHVVAREEGSGTRDAFETLVMGQVGLIIDSAILQPSNGALRTTVAGDPDSIGFLSMGYVDSTVKALAVDGVEATVENAKSRTYPIIRPLYFLTREEPVGLVKEFIDFALGADGQAIVVEEGFVSIQ
jgi:phosphate transport system substrate-binding protein